MLKTSALYFFSPTGGTKRAGEIFCERISEQVHTVDMRSQDELFVESNEELLVFAVPVFGGRIPAIASENISKLNGDGKKAVTLVVYGNRAYEDALLELNTTVKKAGFHIIASAALVAQHSIVPEVGKGRPDELDRTEIAEFAASVLKKIETGSETAIKVPGNDPFKDEMNMPVTPLSFPQCNQCEACVSICPTGAIRKENNEIKTEPEKCILCMACVRACPANARILPPPVQEMMEQSLGALKSVRSHNEFYL